jgi:hypothetical protein
VGQLTASGASLGCSYSPLMVEPLGQRSTG